MKIANYRQA